MTQIESNKRAEALAAELAEARAEIAELKRKVEGAEQKLTSIDAAPDAIFSLTPDGRYAYANQALADAHGRRIEDMIGKSLWDIFPKEEADRRFASLSQVLRTGEYATVEGPVGQAGSARHYATAIRPIKNAAGSVVSTICTARDVTESKRAEEEHRQSELALEASQRVAHLGNWTWHIKTNRLEWSDEMFRIFGIDRQGFTGDLPAVIAAIHPNDREAGA